MSKFNSGLLPASIPTEGPIVDEFFLNCSWLEFRHVYNFHSRLRHVCLLETFFYQIKNLYSRVIFIEVIHVFLRAVSGKKCSFQKLAIRFRTYQGPHDHSSYVCKNDSNC